MTLIAGVAVLAAIAPAPANAAKHTCKHDPYVVTAEFLTFKEEWPTIGGYGEQDVRIRKDADLRRRKVPLAFDFDYRPTGGARDWPEKRPSKYDLFVFFGVPRSYRPCVLTHTPRGRTVWRHSQRDGRGELTTYKSRDRKGPAYVFKFGTRYVK